MLGRAGASIAVLVLLLAALPLGCSVNPVETVDASGRGGSSGHAGTPGGAGAGGTGAGGAASCAQIESDYSSAFNRARVCNASASDPCQLVEPTSLACPTCKVHVNDNTELAPLQTRYDQAGCSAVPHVCPAIACVNPGTAACVPINSGDFCM